MFLFLLKGFTKMHKNKKPPNMYLVETVGRALPCFRHGTDYILNLVVSGPLAYYAKCKFIC